MLDQERLARLSRMQDQLRIYVSIVLVRSKGRRLNQRAAWRQTASLVEEARAIDDLDLLDATRQLSAIPVTTEEFDRPGSRGPNRVMEARTRIETQLARLRMVSRRRVGRASS